MTQPSCPRCNGGGRVMKLVCDDPAYCPVVECPDCGGTGLAAEKDWQGRPAPAGEPESAVATVWEVDPHPGDGGKGTVLVERSWQGMLSYVRAQLEHWLEAFGEDELRRGVTLTFRLAEVRKDEIPGEG